MFAFRPRVQNTWTGLYDDLQWSDIYSTQQIPNASQRPEFVFHDHGNKSQENRYVHRDRQLWYTFKLLNCLQTVSLQWLYFDFFYSGLRTVFVLDNESCPAVLQSCHPRGESRCVITHIIINSHIIIILIWYFQIMVFGILFMFYLIHISL